MIKKFMLILIALLILSSTALAKPTITADKTYFDITTGLYNLEGNVYIEAGSRIITAGTARVNMATLEVTGLGGITVNDGDIKFSGDSVFVSGAQSKADITGNIIFLRKDLTITADQVTFNWKTKEALFTGHVEVKKDKDTKTYESVKYNVVTDTIL